MSHPLLCHLRTTLSKLSSSEQTPHPEKACYSFDSDFAERRSWSLMNIIALIVSGLIIGVIAKLLMPGRDPGGFIITILLGIAGIFTRL
jgi:hypothetical protein